MGFFILHPLKGWCLAYITRIIIINKPNSNDNVSGHVCRKCRNLLQKSVTRTVCVFCTTDINYRPQTKNPKNTFDHISHACATLVTISSRQNLWESLWHFCIIFTRK